ncbi:MAG: hypothetical protein ACJA00_002365 [Myxococcota bacterium]
MFHRIDAASRVRQHPVEVGGENDSTEAGELAHETTWRSGVGVRPPLTSHSSW